MKMRFYVNGFEEGATYFIRTGNFTWEEIKNMAENNVVITKNGNQFSIELY